jgi:hypothetical protein
MDGPEISLVHSQDVLNTQPFRGSDYRRVN